MGSVWSIYACINSGMRTKYGKRMNKWYELRTMLVNITKYYVPKKSDIISKEQFKTLILLCFDPNDPTDLASIITISLMYCGLLRQSEVHEIRVQDVKVSKTCDNCYVDFARPSKSRARGFGFMLPTFLTPYFKLYCSQLDRSKKPGKPFGETQFLKNFNIRSKKRSQNMGPRKHTAVLRKIELFLGLTPNSMTCHCWRRSAATELANSGISLLGLKRAGRWKNLKSAEEYLEHSIPVQRDRMTRLFGGEKVIVLVAWHQRLTTYSYKLTSLRSRRHNLIVLPSESIMFVALINKSSSTFPYRSCRLATLLVKFHRHYALPCA